MRLRYTPEALIELAATLDYQLSPEDVVIVAVRHTARDPASDAER